MLTKDDKKWIQTNSVSKEWLLENFATKKELKELRDGFDLLRNKTIISTLEKFNIKGEIDAIRASTIRTEEKIDKLITIADGNAGNIADLQQENKMGAITTRRHGINIEHLAKVAGTKLPN